MSGDLITEADVALLRSVRQSAPHANWVDYVRGLADKLDRLRTQQDEPSEIDEKPPISNYARRNLIGRNGPRLRLRPDYTEDVAMLRELAGSQIEYRHLQEWLYGLADRLESGE